MRAKTFAAVAVYSLAGSIGLPLWLYASPRIEAILAPVLTHQQVEFDSDDRTPGRFCWTWKWVKTRPAQPIVSSWALVVDGNAVEFPVVTSRQRDGEVLRAINPAPEGPGQNDICVTIPPDLDRSPGLRVKGQINYRTTHEFWTIWQDLPEIIVPPLPSPKPQDGAAK